MIGIRTTTLSPVIREDNQVRVTGAGIGRDESGPHPVRIMGETRLTGLLIYGMMKG